MRKLVSNPNRGQRRRAPWRRRAARVLATALLASGALASQPASALWSPGGGTGTFGSFDLSSGVSIDIDGDTNADLSILLSSGYGGDVLSLTPAIVNSVNGEVFASPGALVTAYSVADDVLDAVTNGDPTIVAPGSAVLWDSTHLDFQSGGIAGVLFEIPGGSPYVGYLALTVSVIDGAIDGLSIDETGFQPVPEPGTASLLLGAGLLGLAVRRRSRIR
jgi:hypothetical protein